MNEWISVEDRLPPQDTYVLTAKYDSRKNVGMYFIQIASRLGDKWFDDHNCDFIEPKYGHMTHWMPLPEPPNK